ncbi:MAG: hypothetical protein IKP20_05330 [Candidatus Methanomethylophilaceae archaeon]|jgi:hypothetical protein|nr:hypothetical protein [Candidatus Methanomethylophilaceae archaeon]
MGTKCFISMEYGDSIRGVSCSYDGYIGSAGMTLLSAFSDRSLLGMLIDKGDMSSLGTALNNTSFCGGNPRTYSPGEDLCAKESAEYAYVLGEDGRWAYYKIGDPERRDLESDVQKLMEEQS